VTLPQRTAAWDIVAAMADLRHFGFPQDTPSSAVFSITLLATDGGSDVPLPDNAGLSFEFRRTLAPHETVLVRIALRD
jgi:hypothetical protein